MNSPVIGGFTYRFAPAQQADLPTVLALHGTGGNEADLLPLARQLLPGAAILSPRGKVLEHGMPRFFRRLAEGVFDLEDLERRAGELAAFVREAATSHAFDARCVIAVGYSNGANVAGAMLLLHPGSVAAAALFRPMVPLVPRHLPHLGGTPIFVAAGTHDPLVSPAETGRLESLFERAGAEVTVHRQRAGHALEPEEVEAAARWLERLQTRWLQSHNGGA
jgi:predicted esterase